MGGRGVACCSYTIFIIAVIGGAITYIVLCILALVNDKYISDACVSSHIWAYVLTSLILIYTVKVILSKNYILNNNDITKNIDDITENIDDIENIKYNKL